MQSEWGDSAGLLGKGSSNYAHFDRFWCMASPRRWSARGAGAAGHVAEWLDRSGSDGSQPGLSRNPTGGAALFQGHLQAQAAE